MTAFLIETLRLTSMTRCRATCYIVLSLLAGCGLVSGSAASLDRNRCMRLTGDPAETEAACSRVIERGGPDRPMLARAHAYRAVVRSWTQRIPAALHDADRAVELDPGGAFGYSTRAAIRADAGDVAKAFRDFEAAHRLDPGNPDVAIDWAIAHERIGQPEQALMLVERVLLLSSNHPRALGERCWLRAMLARDLDAAIGDCDAVIAWKASDWNSYNSRGFVNFRRGDHEAAIADYDRSIEGDPKVASSFYIRGLAKRALGRIDAGDRDVALAVEMQPAVVDRYRGYGIEPPSD